MFYVSDQANNKHTGNYETNVGLQISADFKIFFVIHK
jgi:hypothetical protein